MQEIIHIDTVAQANQMLGLQTTRHPLISVHRYEGTSHDGIDVGEARISSELYFISFKEFRVGSFGYGRNTYDFEAGSMIFISPQQVLSMGNVEEVEEQNGWLIFFHPDLIRKSPLGKEIDTYSYFSYEAHEALHLSQEERSNIKELVDKIDKELQQNIDKHSQELIIANLELLLKYCNRYYDRQFYTRTNLNKDFVSKFEALLKDYYHSDRPSEMGIPTVKYCGEALNMSPKYLSDLLRKETGRSAQDHIHFFVIEKAKTDLLNSVGPVSEVAYGLGFEYPQHFSKLFKKKVGMSPTEYRTLN